MADKSEIIEVDTFQKDSEDKEKELHSKKSEEVDNQQVVEQESNATTKSSEETEEKVEETEEDKLRKELEELAKEDINELINRYIALYKELEETKALRDEYLETAQRVQASFENYKKQVDKNIAWSNFHNKSKILTKFLTIYDDLERTLEAFDKHPDVPTAREAISMVLRNMQSTLESLDLTLIEPTLKERFNPEYHEAIHIVETSDEDDNSIIEVVSKGFKLENTVIRPAKVVIAKKPKNKTKEGE